MDLQDIACGVVDSEALIVAIFGAYMFQPSRQGNAKHITIADTFDNTSIEP